MKRSAKDVLAGLAFVGFGLAFAIGALAYDIGDPVRMGPGFFPLVVGVLLAILGALIAVTRSNEPDEEPISAPPWRAAALIRERKYDLAALMSLEVGKSRLEAMGVEPGRARHAAHASLVVEQDLPFR